jgi:glycosyltransferase involved in cell wall biosynthesis
MEHAGLKERTQQYADMGVAVKSLSREEPEIDPPHAAGSWQRKVALWHRVKRLARIVKRWNIDVIDARTAAYFPAALAGSMTSTPTAVTLYHGIRQGDDVAWTSALRTSLALADRVLTDSEVRATEFRNHLYWNKNKVAVIPNGIPQPHSNYSRDEARKILGLPEDPAAPVIGQVARLIDFKGQAVLLRAAPAILARYPSAAFLLVGFTEDEQYRNHLKQLANDLGIADHVRLVSYPGSVGDVWRAIDIHVHPSLFDSLPVAIIEGMAVGKPVVATSAGGIPELVEHERTGLIVPPGDSPALANAVLRLLDNRELASELGDGARQRYEQRYRPEIMTSKLEALFVEMAR